MMIQINNYKGGFIMKNVVLFCTGMSGTGKSHFIKNYLSQQAFYNLKSATTRPMREGEQDGREYNFRDEKYFDTEKFATKLWVNEKIWKPGNPKWLYGVTETEIFCHLGYNLTYDVIEPKYIRQMIDWFKQKDLNCYYDFKILWFQTTLNAKRVVEARQNMPNDTLIRKTNTCTLKDFNQAHLLPDFILINSPEKQVIDNKLLELIKSLIMEHNKQK